MTLLQSAFLVCGCAMLVSLFIGWTAYRLHLTTDSDRADRVALWSALALIALVGATGVIAALATLEAIL